MARLTRAESQMQTRERLLQSAREAFLRDGYVRASIDAIAEDAGYSKGAVYSNFAGKEALFFELLKQKFEGEIAALQALAASHEGADDLLAAMREHNAAHPEVLDFTLVSAEFQTQVARGSQFAETYAALYAGQRKALAELVTAIFARAGKELPAPAEELAGAAIALTIGLAVLRGADREAVSAQSWGRAAELYFRGLLAAAEDMGARRK
jgi:Transcriptional regulator